MSIVITKKKVAKKRIRRTPEEARASALDSARRLLLTKGPDAITLQAVASDLGMSHTNLIHHFGSAGGLQSALMSEMVRELTAVIEKAIERFRAGAGDVHDFVNIVFDAFDTGGAGRLAAWIVLSGEADKLEPVGEVVQTYLRNVERGADASHGDAHERLTSASLLLTMAAFGDAVIGDNLGAMMGREREATRKIVARLLPQLLMIKK